MKTPEGFWEDKKEQIKKMTTLKFINSIQNIRKLGNSYYVLIPLVMREDMKIAEKSELRLEYDLEKKILLIKTFNQRHL